MADMIELTDALDDNDKVYAVVPVEQVAAIIREWYPADGYFARQSDLDKIDEFQAALIAEDDEAARELAAELAVGFDHVQTD